MPLTTYTAGEVLTAASLNANLSFAASSPAGGLILISSTTIGTTVSSVTVSSAFSATYDNYKIIVNGGSASTNTYLKMTLGATATGYYYGEIYKPYSGALASDSLANGAFWFAARAGTNGSILNMEIQNPFLSNRTCFSSTFGNPNTGGEFETAGGFLDNATSYTAFTLTTNSGTITGGTIRVYGYANS